MSTENTANTSRVITIYSTKGAKKAKIETDVTTWGELQTLVKKEGYDLDKLHATENINKSDLVNNAAVLPTGEFTIFLRPKQTKSGAERADGLAYKDIKAMIKSDIEAHEEAGKAHYNEGKNYTTKSTDELRSLANSYVAPAGKAVAEKAPKAKAAKKVEEVGAESIEEVAPVKVLTNADHIEAIKYHLGCIVENASSEDVKDRANEIADDFLPGLEAEVTADTDASTTTANIADVVQSVADSKETPEEEGKRLAREKAQKEEEDKIAQEKAEKEAAIQAEKEEDERLAKEAKELGL